MKHADIAPLIEKLTASIERHIARSKDPEIYALLQAVTAAFASNDEKGDLAGYSSDRATRTVPLCGSRGIGG